MEITEEQIDVLGKMADTADNLSEAAKLKVRPEIHIECLTSALKEMSDQLKEIVVSVSGDNPWSEYGE